MEDGGEIPAAPVKHRKVAATITAPFFPQEVSSVSSNGLNLAIEYIKGGKRGLVVAYTHRSKREGLAMMNLLFNIPELRKVRIVSPVAHHTYSNNPLFDAAARFTGIEFLPIVTAETRDLLSKKGQTDPDPRRRSFLEYLYKSVDALKDGAVLPIALQAAGKQETLGPPTSALSSLVRIAEKNNVDNFGVLFVGLTYPREKEQNKKMHGYNPLRKMQLNIGNFYTADQLNDIADNNPKNLDPWAFGQLAELMPKWYSPPR